MHTRNRLYVTIGLIYGLLVGLVMPAQPAAVAEGAGIRISLAIHAFRVWPVLWSANAAGRATNGPVAAP